MCTIHIICTITITIAIAILQGYTLEYEAGTAQFAALFFGLHLATAVLLLHFRFTVCLPNFI